MSGTNAGAAIGATAVPGSPPEALEQRTVHVFISRALTKILRKAPKKHTQDLRRGHRSAHPAPASARALWLTDARTVLEPPQRS